jgi:hypothetical protein
LPEAQKPLNFQVIPVGVPWSEDSRQLEKRRP